MTATIEQLREAVQKAKTVVFFGGAGVSTESGIPDFRSVDGLYNQKYDYPPETILSHTFFVRHPEEFYRFYHDKLLSHDAQPHAAHKKLAEWEQQGKLNAQLLGRGYTWMDAGTMDSLRKATNFVCMIEQYQGMTISAPEEIAYRYKWITAEQLKLSVKRYGKSPYGEHLKAVLENRIIL